MTVYIDLDGVLANFELKVQQLLGDGVDWKVEIDSPNWGRISNFQDIYLHLPTMPDAYVLMDYLRNKFDDIQILTAIPRRAYFPEAVNHKREWVWKNFGSHIKVNFGPYAYDKQFHCRPAHCMPQDILIDDMAINCSQWRERGGLGILHFNAIDTINVQESLYKKSAS